MNAKDLEQLTTKEIAKLYQGSREEFARQRSKQQAAEGRNALVIGDENYWKDEFGYVHAGVRPQPASGCFDEDMLIAEERRFTPDKLVDFVNANLSDPEIADLLPQEEHVVIAQYRSYEICGSFHDGEWHLRAIDTVGEEPKIRFRMPGTLDQDTAAIHARNYVQNQLALRLRELSQGEINFVQRIATTNREWAVALYLKSRLPSRFEKELNRLAAEIEQTGSALELMRFMSDPDVNSVAEEAVFNVWSFSQPHVQFTQELQDFLQQRTANTLVTFALLDKLYSQYNLGRAVALTTAPAPVSEEQLNSLPDDEIDSLYKRSP